MEDHPVTICCQLHVHGLKLGTKEKVTGGGVTVIGLNEEVHRKSWPHLTARGRCYVHRVQELVKVTFAFLSHMSS